MIYAFLLAKTFTVGVGFADAPVHSTARIVDRGDLGFCVVNDDTDAVFCCRWDEREYEHEQCKKHREELR